MNVDFSSRPHEHHVILQYFKTSTNFGYSKNGTAVLKATNTAPTSRDLMKLSNSIGENSMAWIEGKAAYSRLLSIKHCERSSQAHRKMI